MTTKTLAVAGLLVATGLAALVAVPPAAAHDCSSTTPDGCGPCVTGGAHDHRGPGGIDWCVLDVTQCIRQPTVCFGETPFHLYLETPNTPQTPIEP